MKEGGRGVFRIEATACVGLPSRKKLDSLTQGLRTASSEEREGTKVDGRDRRPPQGTVMWGEDGGGGIQVRHQAQRHKWGLSRWAPLI